MRNAPKDALLAHAKFFCAHGALVPNLSLGNCFVAHITIKLHFLVGIRNPLLLAVHHAPPNPKHGRDGQRLSLGSLRGRVRRHFVIKIFLDQFSVGSPTNPTTSPRSPSFFVPAEYSRDGRGRRFGGGQRRSCFWCQHIRTPFPGYLLTMREAQSQNITKYHECKKTRCLKRVDNTGPLVHSKT